MKQSYSDPDLCDRLSWRYFGVLGAPGASAEPDHRRQSPPTCPTPRRLRPRLPARPRPSSLATGWASPDTAEALLVMAQRRPRASGRCRSARPTPACSQPCPSPRPLWTVRDPKRGPGRTEGTIDFKSSPRSRRSRPATPASPRDSIWRPQQPARREAPTTQVPPEPGVRRDTPSASTSSGAKVGSFLAPRKVATRPAADVGCPRARHETDVERIFVDLHRSISRLKFKSTRSARESDRSWLNDILGRTSERRAVIQH